MVTSFLDVQRLLDKALGSSFAGNHGAFWRGKTRDEFVDLQVFGRRIISFDSPEESLLVQALKGNISAEGGDSSQLCLSPDLPAALVADVETVSNWISQGCPDTEAVVSVMAKPASARVLVDDTVHVEYWRSIDYFFLPSLASPETRNHVLRLHMGAFGNWKASKVLDDPNDPWSDYISDPNVQTSFKHVRLHQRRIIDAYYGSSQDNLFDSLWKFGGNLLPLDPQADVLPPNRTMNSQYDWFWWIPYLELSLTADDMTEADLQLGRAWQVGIIADGLVRRRLDIPDFAGTDPNLQTNVKAAFAETDAGSLIDLMVDRTRRFARNPGFPSSLGWPRPGA
jgi:hypothetical protein